MEEETDLANPEKKWEGFRPKGYWLDAKKVRNLPLARVSRTPEGDKQDVPTTVGKVLESIAGQQITEVHGKGVATTTGEIELDGAPFNRYLLEALLDLQKDGIKGFGAIWFWYDSDVGYAYPGSKAYEFFVVYEDRIVRERVVLIDDLDGELSSVFANDDAFPATWGNMKESDDSYTRFWYRKFYRETRTGQLMVLRPDEPELYYYPEGRWRLDNSLALIQDGLSNINSGLAKIRFVLWLLAGLAFFVVLILLWR